HANGYGGSAMDTSRVYFNVRGPGDIQAARAASVPLARDAGLGETESQEIALVVAELGTNLLRHAGGGTLELSRIEAAARTGIEIEALDHGPGITDVDQAMTDGYSTVGGLGAGLGAVHRLTDELEIAS